MNKIKIIALVLLALFLTSCSSKGMVKVDSSQATDSFEQPTDGTAKVTFIRPSSRGGGEAATITAFSHQDSSYTLVGVVKQKRKVSINLQPGKYTFITRGGNTNFTEAELSANKVYFAHLRSKFNPFTLLFSYLPVYYATTPIHSDESLSEVYTYSNPKFMKWVDACTEIAKTDETEEWFVGVKPKIQAKYEKGYFKWIDSLSEEELKLKTISATDFFDE